MPTPRVSIRTEDFDLSIEVAALRAGNPAVGAVCSFVGTVRDRNDAGDGLEANPPGQTIAHGDVVRFIPFAELLN